MSDSKKIKGWCNSCLSETNHDLLYEKEDHGSEEIGENFSIEWGTLWKLIQCRGCEQVSLKRESWNSETFDEHGRTAVDSVYFPPRIFRDLPPWLKSRPFRRTCPRQIEQLMKELYIALQNGCHAAAAMLTRATFEHLMIHQIGDQGSFGKNLKKFKGAGFVGEKQADVVSSMLEVGHASIHRSFIPQKEDIVTLVDILEGALKVVYVDLPKAVDLRKRIPKRKKPQPTAAASGDKPPGQQS